MSVELREEAVGLLRQALNDSGADFRDGQWEAIERLVGERSRLLVVQRTGWGKSIVYFLATRLLRDRGAGPTLLVSPLLSLMRNQILASDRLNVRAATINSSNKDDWAAIHASLRADRVDILLISPERLANDEFRENVLLPVAGSIGLFVVDEAHCISDWGHDFRPDYLRIARILQALPPNVPALATTATANNRVVDDVVAQLGRDVAVSRGPLARESLRLQNISLPRQSSRMAWLAEQIPKLKGSGIVYALTIRDAQRLAEWLQREGIDAHAYWGGQESSEREELEKKLLDNKVKALVATTALGMGFDKPDLGFVIHYQRPGSVVHYYQQVGRAGRALTEAYGVLLSGHEDREITEHFIKTAFPPEGHVEHVLDALREADDGLSVPMMENAVNLGRGQLAKVLTSLAVKSPSPVSKIGPRWYANPVPYSPDQAKINHLTRLRYKEQERMLEYIESRECLMRFLARELDDPDPEPCGRCAVCMGGPLLPETFTPQVAARAMAFLKRNDQPIEPRKRWAGDALAAYGWTGAIKPEVQFEEGRALSTWGDDGWAELVRQGKQESGNFSDELVEATVGLIRERWGPQPSPTWVTCIPSARYPGLVPDFARRVARSLGLHFSQCIARVRPGEPQRDMQNSYRQARNLEGAFAVQSKYVRDGPLLLIDESVDSRWTFTVVAALLREAGSGPVFPFALVDTHSRDDA